MTGKQTFSLFLFLCIMLFNLNAQYLSTSGKTIVNDEDDPVLLRGMGLGGWMLQEGYMLQTADFANAQYKIRNKIEELIGPDDTQLFYDAWLTNHVQKVDIDSLKSWGFNSVRLPMHYNLFTLPIEEEPVPGEHTWLTKGFELTDSLISWCAQNEMYVILDLHAAPGGQGQDQGISDYDPTKPSLWESEANRDKTVALWKKLAERYVDEPWVGGYDLINEPNWELPGNVLLRELYQEITDSIRAVDTQHIIFIEGNWFANDFTGLTPPWDDNMVYSPHKYWSYNDQDAIQWVLNIRESHNVPLYFGESGENSNTWFRDAIRLMEDHNIGWAWWPMKKVESIAGPLSVEKTPEYQTLLNYWNGVGNTPSPAFAKAALLQLAEDFKMENCVYQQDVIDAMFRQVYSDEAVPYHTQAIPGVVYATDFDMGVAGVAYHDSDLANYHVSTGTYTAWNSGWTYRNDGVDIEASQDVVNNNGYHVGWLANGEWMQYDVDVSHSAKYDIELRVAANETGGKVRFSAGGADITGTVDIPQTGGWDSWETVLIPDVILLEEESKLRIDIENSGFNLSSFEFIEKGPTTSLATKYVSAVTLDKKRVQLHVNKPLEAPLPPAPANFKIYVNGNSVQITDVVLNPSNNRIVELTLDYTMQSSDDIKISYTGIQITAQDGTSLSIFSQKEVRNTIAAVHTIPGKIEAEAFFSQTGIQLENTTDVGGGQNISYLDAGDFLDYKVDVSQTGLYQVDYRTAALSETGQVQLQLIDENGNASTLHTQSFPSTGGWQSWTTTSANAFLEEGQQQLRIRITQPLFNINWFEFTFLTSTEEQGLFQELNIFPNPSNTGLFWVEGRMAGHQEIYLNVFDLQGKKVFEKEIFGLEHFQSSVNLSPYPDGLYILFFTSEDGRSSVRKIQKMVH